MYIHITYIYIHTYIHTLLHIYIYIYIYASVSPPRPHASGRIPPRRVSAGRGAEKASCSGLGKKENT